MSRYVVVSVWKGMCYACVFLKAYDRLMLIVTTMAPMTVSVYLLHCHAVCCVASNNEKTGPSFGMKGAALYWAVQDIQQISAV
ncbi:MAG TPA: hypothetical protein ACQGQI_07120 [Xylella sp.]